MLCLMAQQTEYGKMSFFIRQLVQQQERQKVSATKPGKQQQVCAFVNINGSPKEVLSQYGATYLDQLGHVTMALIPTNQLLNLTRDTRIKRIEAKEGRLLAMDRTPADVNTTSIYDAVNLPQAYTGKGVVVGIEDVGFDLTHPNFFDATGTQYRIKALWDQLATQEPESELYVGREFLSQTDLLNLKHTTDGLIQAHGTHTAGCAAGSGGTTNYRGVAFESDICLVANAVSTNAQLIPEEDRDKYTYTTDVLGFKYIFDYAQAHNQPCVISFSEGSAQDFRGDDQLFYDALAALVGEGRILVASAGNEGVKNTYIHKPADSEKAGAMYICGNSSGLFSVRADGRFSLTLAVWQDNASITINSDDVLAAEEQTYNTTFVAGSVTYPITVKAYPSCYNSAETIYDFTITLPEAIGYYSPAGIQMSGLGTNAELFCYNGFLNNSDSDTDFDDAKSYANVFSPGSAPSVICVASNSYKNQFVNINGETVVYDKGLNGEWADYSSVGPTYDNRIKPDVVAPGTNIISSFNKYYMENTTSSDDFNNLVCYSEGNYPWYAASGTSMSTPVVAGVIALWLQACPTLTTQQVLEVMQKTCKHIDTSLEYPNNKWGYGEIDAYKGLLEVLKLSNIDGLSQEMPTHLTILPDKDGQIVIKFKESVNTPVNIRIYSVDGKILDKITAQAHAESITVKPNINISRNTVYAIQVNAGTRETTGSALVRF